MRFNFCNKSRLFVLIGFARICRRTFNNKTLFQWRKFQTLLARTGAAWHQWHLKAKANRWLLSLYSFRTRNTDTWSRTPARTRRSAWCCTRGWWRSWPISAGFYKIYFVYYFSIYWIALCNVRSLGIELNNFKDKFKGKFKDIFC